MKQEIKKYKFGMDNNRLIDLVIQGKKKATTSIYEENDTSSVGEESILVYDNNKDACLLKTLKVIVTEFKNINEELALLEGEGSYKEWRAIHINFFKSIDPNFNENTLVEFEIFKVIKVFNNTH